MERELTCIVCPRGCTIKVKYTDDNILSIDGYTCERGKEYAQKELTNPERTVTSTVLTSDGSVLPVKTEKAIQKSKIFECMDEINKAVANLPVKAGDVIIKNVANTGVNVIATKSSC